ncbi:PucR family transcriptional regulator [Streptomyces antimicrobicus]|uniref:Helix-turn-helix domain-containing protein n=1 Tax=Streptomyces antimicrobicus TaxID=2883108 RepID=A0ABS8BDK4_9ACTN|nr:PucR family transcriptional regulator [Streptomyces antimicrobicus]MCB5182662.1 helix-turn-helix domain-containing protein [Streptomyces antimicrobicus]
MCELLNRIWSRPRGEWTRVLRRELPALAAKLVEELLHGPHGRAALGEDIDAIDDELLVRAVEQALLVALGYRITEEPAAVDHRSAHPAAHQDRPADPPAPLQERDRARGHDEPHDHAPDGCSLPPDRDRARQELFLALTGDCAPTDRDLAALAAAAGWPPPAAVRAVALASPGETQQLAAALDDALAGLAGGQPCLLVPSPDGDRRSALELALRGRFAAVGHPVPLRDAASSLRWASRLLALSPGRNGPDARAEFVDDHLSTLMLLQDEPLAHALAARWLRPLADLTPRQSERLEVTLLAWLEGGGAPEAAKALSVHPQTVRYRMRQLEKLFGADLRDPRTRFELEMALRSRRLMAQVRRQHSRVGRRVRPVTTEFRPLGLGARMARVNGL